MFGQEVPFELELMAMAQAVRYAIKAQPDIEIDNLEVYVDHYDLILKGATNDASSARLAQAIVEEVVGMIPFRSLILIRNTFH